MTDEDIQKADMEMNTSNKVTCEMSESTVNLEKSQSLQEIIRHLEIENHELTLRCEQAIVSLEKALREKETIVIRYATSEKNVMCEIEQKEKAIRMYKELEKENELLDTKCQRMILERERISEMYHSKCNELKETIEKLESSQLQAKQGTDEIENVAKESLRQISIQLQEQQAAIILLKHEKAEKEQEVAHLKETLHKLQDIQHSFKKRNCELLEDIEQIKNENLKILHRNNVLEEQCGKETSKLKYCEAKCEEVDDLKEKLQREESKLSDAMQEFSILETSNNALHEDVHSLKSRETELLAFTKQVTERNAELQCSFNSLELKIEQLSLENNFLKRKFDEQADIIVQLSKELSDIRKQLRHLSNSLDLKDRLCEEYKQKNEDLNTEYVVTKRKLNMTIKERLHNLKRMNIDNTMDRSDTTSICNQEWRELQNSSSGKSERIDYLEDQLVKLQKALLKKTRIIKCFILKYQERSISNTTDEEKVNISNIKLTMKTILKSKMLFSKDICKKLQDALEDALYENIILKESVETLGDEIARLSTVNEKNECLTKIKLT